MMAEENDQMKLQQLLLQIRSYQAALQDLSKQSAFAEQAIAEVSATLDALEELPKSKEKEAFIPIGAGVFTKAEITDKDSFIVTAGKGIHLEKNAKDAVAFLTERKEKLVENEKFLKDEADKINAELDSANSSAEELYAKLQSK
jgi:prefoldin alpha subunit